MKNLYSIHLDRSDLMELEGHLVDALRKIFPFVSHSLYFPTAQNSIEEPQWIPKERTLLLPLRHRNKDFGVFMARGAKARDVRKLLQTLPKIAELCLEHLLCIKQSRTDELTGLARMSRLLMRMEHYADMVRSPLMAGTEDQNPSYKACMSLLVIRYPDLNSLATEYGYMFAHKAISSWAKAIQKDLPYEVVAARSGEYECTLLLPAATRSSCTKLAHEILKRIAAIKLTHTPSKRVIRLNCVAGFALYPQDMESKRVALPMSEQAHYLLHKARLATDIAFERSKFYDPQDKQHPPCIAYSNIIAQGGIIRDILPLGQLLTNLGRAVGAKEGQCFTVWGPQNVCKGEIVLIDVQESHSIAEAILHDPAWPWEQGDSLRTSTEVTHHSQNYAPNAESTQAKDDATISSNPIIANTFQANTNILSHADFLRQFTKERESKANFALALVRLSPPHADILTKEQEQSIQNLAELCTNTFHQTLHTDSNFKIPLLCGKYGATSLIFFHAGATADALYDLYIHLANTAKNHDMHLSIGLASYPYLQCSKGDMLEACHKALELALLLPNPQVGVMGTLALNISADQYYSQGNTFKAVEEYKLALLADPKNAMAWNSLGVCMAAVNRLGEARQYFKEALKLWKKTPPQEPSEFTATLYNLGTVCQNLKEFRSAARYFRQCIQVDDKHYFAHIRLGQLAEISGRYKQARQHFTTAATYEDTQKHGGVARRHLARVALRQRRDAEARELLHEALLRNAQDAIALSMLAKLYLDGGEDPSMSEMLARRSVGLRPEYGPSWQILADSLRALGREHDALQVENRI